MKDIELMKIDGSSFSEQVKYSKSDWKKKLKNIIKNLNMI